jgi:hypothetical protein
MGSELLVGVLEMDRGQEPRWAAAEAMLTEMSDEDVKSAYMQATDTTEEMLEERGVELPTMRAEIQAALDALRDAWDGAGGDVVRYPGARTEMLIGGGTSWGEDIEACTQINLFWESGMARVAGFAVVTDEATIAG